MAIERVVRDFRVTGLGGPSERWWFNISVRGCPPEEESDEWVMALDEFKDSISLLERRWDPDLKAWRVDASPANERRMVEQFDNFASCLKAARSQLRMEL